MLNRQLNVWLRKAGSEAEKLLPTPEAKEKLKEFAEFLIKRNK